MALAWKLVLVGPELDIPRTSDRRSGPNITLTITGLRGSSLRFSPIILTTKSGVVGSLSAKQLFLP